MYAFCDGCFFTSNSGQTKLTACPTKGEYSIIKRRRLKGEMAAPRLGKHVHSAIAHRNKLIWAGKGLDGLEEAQIKLLEQLFASTPCPDEDWRNFSMAQGVIKMFNLEFGQEELKICTAPDGEAFVEKAFTVDTGITLHGWRIIYTGTIDLAVRHPEGIFIRDYKTTTMLGDNFWKDLEMSEAQRGYCWAFKQTMGEEPVGYEITALAMRKPTKTGTSIEFARQRYFTKQPPGQLDEWYQNMMAQCETFLWHFKKGVFPRHHNACITKFMKPCEFFNVCAAPKEVQESELLGPGFEEDDGMSLY